MANDKPQIFIASSTEGLDIAYAIQDSLEFDAECTVWNQGVFEPSSYTMVDLIKQLSVSEYGIFVFSPDDTVKMRGEEEKVVRDNVILELGLFMGALGREKCFIIMPNSKEKIHLPTDLMGITSLKYNATRSDENLVAALGPAVNKIRNTIKKKKATKMTVSKDIMEQITSVGLSAFYSSRNDYGKYREDAGTIDKYISRAKHSICMVSITLNAGILSDDIGRVFREKLEKKKDFKVTVSLLNPYIEELYRAIDPMFGQTASTLKESTIDALKSLNRLRSGLDEDAQSRFVIKVHHALPFGSAIILDGDFEKGTIQIETKPYGVGMRKSFAFEITNNGGEFYNTIKTSYYELIKDGNLWDEVQSRVAGE